MAELDGVRSADPNEISMLVDMFYLPFECGKRAMNLLEQFSWLYANAIVMRGTSAPEDTQPVTQDEWRRRLKVFQDSVQVVNNFFKYIVDCPNKASIARWMNEGYLTARPGSFFPDLR
ncbi:unnamed protein product [Cylicostephanus goldi]|uniref:Uncharacterized protein n=1 Tax=Cylicostephanus goldi TaxID=71465 RepID=A0A3P6R1P2_CYLGO|nr:unnamed protein product [Cylicostephanus goldi]